MPVVWSVMIVIILAPAAMTVAVIVAVVVVGWGTYENFEVGEEREECEGWWGLACWCCRMGVGQNNAADAVSPCTRGVVIFCGVVGDGGLAECRVQNGEAGSDADVFVEHVERESAPMFAHQCERALIAQRGVG